MRTERIHTNIAKVRREWLNRKRVYTLCIAAVVLVMFACVAFSLNISAHGNHTEDPVNFTYYKSITIHPGDTLWAIAEEYMIEDYKSVADYVAALKEMNNLYTDDIHAGQALMVAYNDTEFVN